MTDLLEVDLGCSETEEVQPLESTKTLEVVSQEVGKKLSLQEESEAEVELGCDESIDLEENNSDGQEDLKMNQNFRSQLLEDEIKNWAENTGLQCIEDDHSDFFKYAGDNEIHYPINPSYLSQYQPEMSPSMRAILIDWMIEVCTDFHLKRDTLHLAVNFLDRYLSFVPNIPKWKFQLIGITSLFAAAKVEVKCPFDYLFDNIRKSICEQSKDFAKSTDDGYTAEQIKEMELELYKVVLFYFKYWYLINSLGTPVETYSNHAIHAHKYSHESMG